MGIRMSATEDEWGGGVSVYRPALHSMRKASNSLLLKGGMEWAKGEGKVKDKYSLALQGGRWWAVDRAGKWGM